MHKLIAILLLLIATSLACNNEISLSEEPQIPPTRTPLPTFTPAPVAEATIVIPPTPTETPIPTETFTPEPTETPTETPTEIPTEPPAEESMEEPAEEPTEEPPTNTPEPAQPVEQASEPVSEPEPAQAEEPPPPAGPVAGAHGVIGNLTFRDGRNTYGVGEQVFVHIEAKNVTESMVSFGILGLATSTGQFQSSWTEDAIAAGGPFNHEDGISFPTPGNHKLWLSVCFSTKDVCQSPDGDWERFEPGLDVVIQ